MALAAEEQAAVDREARDCRVERERLLALSGNPEAAKAVDLAFEPLLPRAPLPFPPCRLPYEAPELLP